MNLVVIGIIACEIGFWALLFGGLAARYLFRLRRLSSGKASGIWRRIRGRRFECGSCGGRERSFDGGFYRSKRCEDQRGPAFLFEALVFSSEMSSDVHARMTRHEVAPNSV